MESSVTSLTASGNPLLSLLEKTEEALLTLLLLAMILLACAQIALRSFLGTGLVVADALLPHLVLWCGLLGAVTAAGQGKHIALDIAANQMPKKLVPLVTLSAHGFAACAGAGLSYAAILFFMDEYRYGGSGPLSLPSWAYNAIFPLAFSLISCKYLILFLLQLHRLVKPHDGI